MNEITELDSAVDAVRELLEVYDAQVRGTVASRLPGTWTAHPDARVLRVRTPHRGFAFSDGLVGATVDELDGYVLRTREFFAASGESVEWKLYSNDHPQLPERLRAAGFRPEDEESVMVGRVQDLLEAGQAPPSVTIRATTERRDLDRIAAMELSVWGQDWSWLAEDLSDRVSSAPADIVILVAEAEDTIVSAGWLVIMPGTQFSGLWGGSTLAEWRGKGIYRALVAERARIANARGLTFVQVDASDDSRPILERLGLVRVATTTPWVWEFPGCLG
ncbi:GNAT family N-acetyltransferase [Jatrophihabitans sp. DSM 45814]